MNRMVPRRAGQYARERSKDFTKKVVMYLGGAYVLGVAFLVATGSRSVMFYAATSAALAAAYFSIFHRDDTKFIMREITNWRKGAAGEEQVGRELETLESLGYRFIHDLDTGRGNIDHIAVGPNGVFVIETKANTGRFWLGKGGRLMIGNYDQEKWLTQAQREAMEVKECLRRVDLNVWVEALIVLTQIQVKSPVRRNWCTVISLKDLVPTIQKKKGPSLDESQIAKAVASIYRGRQTVKVGL